MPTLRHLPGQGCRWHRDLWDSLGALPGTCSAPGSADCPRFTITSRPMMSTYRERLVRGMPDSQRAARGAAASCPETIRQWELSAAWLSGSRGAERRCSFPGGRVSGDLLSGFPGIPWAARAVSASRSLPKRRPHFRIDEHDKRPDSGWEPQETTHATARHERDAPC